MKRYIPMSVTKLQTVDYRAERIAARLKRTSRALHVQRAKQSSVRSLLCLVVAQNLDTATLGTSTPAARTPVCRCSVCRCKRYGFRCCVIRSARRAGAVGLATPGFAPSRVTAMRTANTQWMRYVGLVGVDTREGPGDGRDGSVSSSIGAC